MLIGISLHSMVGISRNGRAYTGKIHTVVGLNPHPYNYIYIYIYIYITHLMSILEIAGYVTTFVGCSID